MSSSCRNRQLFLFMKVLVLACEFVAMTCTCHLHESFYFCRINMLYVLLLMITHKMGSKNYPAPDRY